MFKSKYLNIIAKENFRLLRLEQVGRDAVVLDLQARRLCPTAAVLYQNEILTKKVLPL